MKTRIIPYFKMPSGYWSIDTGFMEELFHEMESEGFVDVVFMDGAVRTCGEFIELMQSDRAKMFLLLNTENDVAGFFYLNWFEGKSARVHFCMLNRVDTMTKIQAAKDFLSYVFSMTHEDGKPLFDALIGSTPVRNKPASSLAVHLGFKEIGIQPCAAINAATGESEDVVLRYLKKDMLRG